MKTFSFSLPSLRVWTAVLIWFGLAAVMSAHDPGLSTVTVQLRSGTIDAALVLSLKDAEALTGVNTSRENAPSLLRSVAGDALEIRCDGRRVGAEVLGCRFDGASNATVRLRIKAEKYSTLSIRSKCLALLPPGHRQFVTIQDARGEVLAKKLLSATSDFVALELNDSDASTTPAAPKNLFADFLLLGVKHILTGYDHVLFLFSLLIVTRSFVSTLKVITCFTLAHSITLALAALGVIQIPGRIVDPIIAASIIYVGVENLVRGNAPKGRSLLTFTFGLVHGLGFASVLRELGVGSTASEIAVPLLSFNLGVELGQLLIAAVLLPLIWRISERPAFAKRWLPACSAFVTLAGGYWLVQRICFV